MKRFPFPRELEVAKALCTHRKVQKEECAGKKICDQQRFGAVEHGGTLSIRKETSSLLCRATGKELRASDSKAPRTSL